jgi:transcriptional regulator GlxA family with amidase domain
MKQIVMAQLRSPESTGLSLMTHQMDPRIADVLSAVLNRPHYDHSLDKLTAMARMSETRFSYHFSKACSCRPQEFVHAVRLATAAKLLRQSSLQVKDIAASVGLSYSAFRDAFKTSYGSAPSDYRETFAQSDSRELGPSALQTSAMD